MEERKEEDEFDNMNDKREMIMMVEIQSSKVFCRVQHLLFTVV